MKTINHPQNQHIDLFGDTFLLIPRKVAYMLHQPNKEIKQLAQVLIALFTHVYHTDSYRYWQGIRYRCRRGEYVGSLKELEKFTGLNQRAVTNAINTLIACKLIRIEKISRGSRIHLIGYLEFLNQLKNPVKQQKQSPESPLDDLPTPEQIALTEAAYNMFNF